LGAEIIQDARGLGVPQAVRSPPDRQGLPEMAPRLVKAILQKQQIAEVIMCVCGCYVVRPEGAGADRDDLLKQ
jgi:hypothetical protein